MLNGIIVLNQTPITNLTLLGGIIIISIAFSGFIFLLSALLQEIKLVLISIIVGILLIISFFNAPVTKPTGRYEYKVTLSEKVNALEFYSKYEIVEKDGEIFTIIERE